MLKEISIRKVSISFLAFLIVLSCMGLLSQTTVNAATAEVGDFTIERSYSTKNLATVKSYNGSGGEITLPEKATLDGTDYVITNIGNSAFRSNKKITSITIPEGYKEITSSAFSGCSNLESVFFPGSLTSIGANAFENCTSLSTVTFAKDTAETLSLRHSIFLNCTALSSIEMPARLSSVDNNFVRGCSNLEKLTIADGAEKFTAEDDVLYALGDTSATLVAYAHGNTRTTFSVPDTIAHKPVKSIVMHGFRGNTHLKQILLPESVVSLQGYAFDSMTALEKLIISTQEIPSLGQSVCTNLPAGSLIIVQSEDIAKAFEPKGNSTYYTPELTKVQVSSSPSAHEVKATISIEAESALTDGKAIYHIYLDSAENVSTLLFKASFDTNQVDKGTFTAVHPDFNVSTDTWNIENQSLVLSMYMGKVGNEVGYSGSERVKLATISIPVKQGLTGTVSATLTKAACSGITDPQEDSLNGQATIKEPSDASIFLANYDVNGDKTINQVDITEAQRYYQARKGNTDWNKASKSDVNGDNVVDIEDLILIFCNLTDF